ncbi:hypothetical protein V6Z12_D07G107200 [Gossypium hirsutum]
MFLFSSNIKIVHIFFMFSSGIHYQCPGLCHLICSFSQFGKVFRGMLLFLQCSISLASLLMDHILKFTSDVVAFASMLSDSNISLSFMQVAKKFRAFIIPHS